MTFVVIALALAAAVAALLAYMTSMPGRSYSQPLPALSGEGRALSLRLRLHVAALAANERNVDLETPARYIEGAFKSQGLEFSIQEFVSGGRKVRNIEAGSGAIVVGAHYDTVPGSPGADDNASGVAVLIELAALLKNEALPIRFVAFANEEMPYFQGPEMGSWTWARRARERGEPIRAMYSLEMLGYYRDAPGSQRYPPPLGLFYPDRADFIAFVGDLGARQPGKKIHRRVQKANPVSFGGRGRARVHPRGDVVGSLVFPQPRLPRDHDHRHRVQPLSALPSAERHARQARLSSAWRA